MTTPLQHMAIDQFGETYHSLGAHPRKALMERIGRRGAALMYIDDKAGKSHHVGWIIGGLWLTVYRVARIDANARSVVTS